jgi:hypothetical protein
VVYVYVIFFLLWPLSPLTSSHFRINLKTVNFRQFVDPLNWGQYVIRPLPTQENTNIETYEYIHVLRRIRTHDPSTEANKDISCPRPHGHCNRPTNINCLILMMNISYIVSDLNINLVDQITKCMHWIMKLSANG